MITKQQLQTKRNKLKDICKKYGVKATFSSPKGDLHCSIHQGELSFPFDVYTTADSAYAQVNNFWIMSHFASNEPWCLLLTEINDLMREEHWDDSDSMTDYFHCSWYNSIHIGKWNKPYVELKPSKKKN